MTHLTAARRLIDRATRLEARAKRPGDTCARLARLYRLEAARELQHVRGYHTRDDYPWPAEQMNLDDSCECL